MNGVGCNVEAKTVYGNSQTAALTGQKQLDVFDAYLVELRKLTYRLETGLDRVTGITPKDQSKCNKETDKPTSYCEQFNLLLEDFRLINEHLSDEVARLETY